MMYADMYVQICIVVHNQKPEESINCPDSSLSTFILLRQAFPMSLQLIRHPASSNLDPPIHSTEVIGICIDMPGFFISALEI